MYKTNAEHTTILEEQVANIPGITATVVGHDTSIEGVGSNYEVVIPAFAQDRFRCVGCIE